MKKFSSLNESVEPKYGIKEPIKNDLYNLIENNVTVKMTGGEPEQLSNVDISIEGKEKLTEELKKYIEKIRVKERVLTLEMVKANIHRNFDMKWLNETIDNLNNRVFEGIEPLSAEEAAPYLDGTKYRLVAGSSKGVYIVFDLNSRYEQDDNNGHKKGDPKQVGVLWYPSSSYGAWAKSAKGEGAYAFQT